MYCGGLGKKRAATVLYSSTELRTKTYEYYTNIMTQHDVTSVIYCMIQISASFLEDYKRGPLLPKCFVFLFYLLPELNCTIVSAKGFTRNSTLKNQMVYYKFSSLAACQVLLKHTALKKK